MFNQCIFIFSGDFPWLSQTEDWDTEIQQSLSPSSSTAFQNTSEETFSTDSVPSKDSHSTWGDVNCSDNRTSGEGSSLSSLDGANDRTADHFLIAGPSQEIPVNRRMPTDDLSIVSLIPQQPETSE